jgi:alkanesulfonate monooxygenase SsuD/methylene tetrahydromethanopterin reductase-like flavin-dependent oxidoreductase (luciferase family)
MSEEVDPRFAARNAEVAAQYLNIALNATNSRVDAKAKRQKIRLQKQIAAGAAGSSNTITNSNVIIADRNAVLKALLEKGMLQNDDSTIDVDV